MSTPQKMKKTERITGHMTPGRGPHGGGMVGQKASNFKSSTRRLVGWLHPERTKIWAIIVAAISPSAAPPSRSAQLSIAAFSTRRSK